MSMWDFFKSLLTTQTGVLLIIFGMLLILIGLVGNIQGKIDPGKNARIAAVVLGFMSILWGAWLQVHPTTVTQSGSDAVSDGNKPKPTQEHANDPKRPKPPVDETKRVVDPQLPVASQKPPDPKVVSSSLNLTSFTVLHDGKGRSREWKFDVSVNGVFVEEILTHTFEDSDRTLVVNQPGSVGWNPVALPASSLYQIDVQGYRGGKKCDCTGHGAIRLDSSGTGSTLVELVDKFEVLGHFQMLFSIAKGD